MDFIDVIGEGWFQEEQTEEPTFHHVYKEGVAKQVEEVLQHALMESYPHFYAKDGILY